MERPDYAKMDAEIAMERGGASDGSSLVHTSIVAVMKIMTVGVLGYRYYFDVWPRLPQGMGGHTLGSSFNTDAHAHADGSSLAGQAQVPPTSIPKRPRDKLGYHGWSKRRIRQTRQVQTIGHWRPAIRKFSRLFLLVCWLAEKYAYAENPFNSSLQ
jgi:hypothetical protein